MLTDGLTLTSTGTVDNLKFKSGSTFPTDPTDGVTFRLTVQSGQHYPGVYYWSSNTSSWIALDSKALLGSAAAIATLGGDSKLSASQLPAIAITDTFVVASSAAMLALVAQTGDVAIRTDIDTTYILKGEDPTVLAGWEILRSPVVAGAVPYDIATQVIGKPTAGAVVLSFYAVRAFSLAANLAGSTARAGVAAAAQAVFSVQKNGVAFSSFTFAAAGTVATLGGCPQTNFAVGDRISVVAPALQDGTLSDISLSILGLAI